MAAAGAAFPFVSHLGANSANARLRMASFGAGGIASLDINSLVDTGLVDLVAVADVDLPKAEQLRSKYPEVKIYQDWRELLSREHRNLDAVSICTPDHMHCAMGMAAMQLGKHVYGQKPLAQNVFETRQMQLQARASKVVTQMGIQVHSSVEYRTAVRLVQSLAIGKIKEVHTWSSKQWGDSQPLPQKSDPVPQGLNWDLWLGVAAERPFIADYYHPKNWRKRLEFGTGTFGDMGCHIYDPVFKALDLTAPISVRSEGPAPNATNWAINAVIHYIFPATRFTEGKTVQVTWYDGDMRPPQSVRDLLGPNAKLPEQGSIFIGAKGIMVLPHVGKPQLLPAEQFQSFNYPELPKLNHWMQFVEACRGNGKTSANFDYSAALTEAVLLGGVATRFPKTTLSWDAKKLRFANLKEANVFLRRDYRPGWEPKWVS